MEYKEYAPGKLRYVIHYPPGFDPKGKNPILSHENPNLPPQQDDYSDKTRFG